MSDQDIRPNTYSQLRSIHQNYIDLYNALYQLKTENKEELNSIYKNIKAELIDSIKDLPKNIIKNILNIIPYNNRYAKSYLSLAKLIYDEYHVEEVNNIRLTLNFLFYKEYEIVLNIPADFSKINSEYLDIQSENTIYRAIMYNDLEQFIVFTEIDGFNQNQKLKSSLYPKSDEGYSLLELCCYHGAVDCFKLLRSKFNSEITQTCLELSFLGKNPEIMCECLKYQKPDKECMRYAIISHNIDFVSFLMNEYNLNINVKCCGKYKNLDSLLVYFDQTNDFEQCFYYSVRFNIPSLCEYFLSHGANINQKDTHRNTALLIAAKNNSKETAELLLSYGANIEATTETTEFIMFHGENFNYRNAFRQTALLVAAQKNSKETAEVLISHGANINYKDSYGHTALLIAAKNNSKQIAEVLISHGANINEKNNIDFTALHIATWNNNKEIAELLLSHGANINEKNNYGSTALHNAAWNNNKEIAQLLISHGANINEKNKKGEIPLHFAASKNSKETAELLISHGANVNDKNIDELTALHIAAFQNSKETAELLLSHGANINEKDKDGNTALHIAAFQNSKETAELLLSHGANINEKDKDGNTAFHIATINGNQKIGELLLSYDEHACRCNL